ncbi:MAG: magnesium chelatase, partial [Phycicoccus sp.]
MSASPAVTTPPAATTLGELRAIGHRARSVRAEIRDNLLAALAEGRDPWPGLHGFGSTV